MRKKITELETSETLEKALEKAHRELKEIIAQQVHNETMKE